MVPADLRSYIALLEEHGDLRRVAVPVSPVHEIGAICRRLQDQEGPAVLFEQVQGSDIPLVCNLFSHRRRIAMLFGVPEGQLAQEYARRSHPSQYRPPWPVSTGPCKEVVRRGEEVDLRCLPNPVWNEGDGGPYITFGAVRIKDPSGQLGNVSINRLQVHGPRLLGVWTASDRDLGRILRMWWDKGQPAPVAVVIGGPPTYMLAACDHLPFGTDETLLAGALQGDSIEVVRCETSDLDVPATAEIVIEGEIPPDQHHPEGPFGEFLGYMGPSGLMPVINVKAVTHRRDPICVGSYEGMPDVETHTLMYLHLENGLRLLLSFFAPEVVDIYVPRGSAGMAVRVSIRKRHESDPRQVIAAAFAIPTFKYVWVFDEDVDIRDEMQVQWALCTRVQPDRDLVVMSRCQGINLDPSADRLTPDELTTLTSRVGVDATRPLGRPFPPVVRFSQETMAAVARRWQEYGLP
nr:MAG: hypothetical protein DIU70_05575 [Bacillota bacterium]